MKTFGSLLHRQALGREVGLSTSKWAKEMAWENLAGAASLQSNAWLVMACQGNSSVSQLVVRTFSVARRLFLVFKLPMEMGCYCVEAPCVLENRSTANSYQHDVLRLYSLNTFSVMTKQKGTLEIHSLT